MVGWCGWRQAVQGEYVDCRTVSWQDEGAASTGARSATFWLATYAGGSMGVIQGSEEHVSRRKWPGLDDGGMLVEAGIGRASEISQVRGWLWLMCGVTGC